MAPMMDEQPPTGFLVRSVGGLGRRGDGQATCAVSRVVALSSVGMEPVVPVRGIEAYSPAVVKFMNKEHPSYAAEFVRRFGRKVVRSRKEKREEDALGLC
uniref:Uncharacterized protein n=1 Tax=Compsopogon caeruleus TaxID=31354 RepID=A0A7S1TCS0_9RHOD|mmetsp:Transcript_18018/g.37359  ORF Transcript_18018/g.37359 Transcript_18018/m.37359 type:complete len:100 (+) Transcript_18018:58-357(+)